MSELKINNAATKKKTKGGDVQRVIPEPHKYHALVGTNGDFKYCSTWNQLKEQIKREY